MGSELLFAVDTNILVYAEGEGDIARCDAAGRLMERLADRHLVIPVQVYGELFRVLHGKYQRAAPEVIAIIRRWADLHGGVDSTWSAMQAALALVAQHGLQIWDALIVAVAAEQRCGVLISEDLQDGFAWQGVTVANPFAQPCHPALAAVRT